MGRASDSALVGAPVGVSWIARELQEEGHAGSTAVGLAANTVRRVAAGKAAAPGKVRGACRSEIEEWSRFKVGLSEERRGAIEKIEASDKALSEAEARRLRERAAFRLTLAEGLLRSPLSDDEPIRWQAAVKLVGDGSADEVTAKLKAEVEGCRFVEAAMPGLGQKTQGPTGDKGGLRGMRPPTVGKPPPGPPKPGTFKGRGGDVKDPEYEKQHPRQAKGRTGGGEWIKKGTTDSQTTVHMQERLREFGYVTKNDGIFGPKTEATLKEFQKDHDLPESGELDPATVEALRQPTDHEHATQQEQVRQQQLASQPPQAGPPAGGGAGPAGGAPGAPGGHSPSAAGDAQGATPGVEVPEGAKNVKHLDNGAVQYEMPSGKTFEQAPGKTRYRTGGGTVIDQANAEFPILRKYHIAFKHSPDDGTDRKIEFYPPGERDSFNRGVPAIEVFGDKASPLDVLGDVVSHYLVNGTDPTLTRFYKEFQESLKPSQKEKLKEQYAWAKEHEGENRQYGEWEKESGMPAYFRGYAFSQWDNPHDYYTHEQIRKFDQMKEYLKTGGPVMADAKGARSKQLGEKPPKEKPPPKAKKPKVTEASYTGVTVANSPSSMTAHPYGGWVPVVPWGAEVEMAGPAGMVARGDPVDVLEKLREAVDIRKAAHEAGDSRVFTEAWSVERELRERLVEFRGPEFKAELHPRNRRGQFRDVLGRLGFKKKGGVYGRMEHVPVSNEKVSSFPVHALEHNGGMKLVVPGSDQHPELAAAHPKDLIDAVADMRAAHRTVMGMEARPNATLAHPGSRLKELVRKRQDVWMGGLGALAPVAPSARRERIEQQAEARGKRLVSGAELWGRLVAPHEGLAYRGTNTDGQHLVSGRTHSGLVVNKRFRSKEAADLYISQDAKRAARSPKFAARSGMGHPGSRLNRPESDGYVYWPLVGDDGVREYVVISPDGSFGESFPTSDEAAAAANAKNQAAGFSTVLAHPGSGDRPGMAGESDKQAVHSDPAINKLYKARRKAATKADYGATSAQRSKGWAESERISNELAKLDPGGDWYFEGFNYQTGKWEVRRPGSEADKDYIDKYREMGGLSHPGAHAVASRHMNVDTYLPQYGDVVTVDGRKGKVASQPRSSYTKQDFTRVETTASDFTVRFADGSAETVSLDKLRAAKKAELEAAMEKKPVKKGALAGALPKGTTFPPVRSSYLTGQKAPDVPGAWAVEHGYGEWIDRGPNVGKSGGVRYFAHDHEAMLFHYLTGKKPPKNFEYGSPGYEQWTYKGKGNKAEREALIRKITQALRARERGDMEAYGRLLESAVKTRRSLGRSFGVLELQEDGDVQEDGDTLRETWPGAARRGQDRHGAVGRGMAWRGKAAPDLVEAKGSMAKATVHEPVGKPGGPGLWHRKGLQLPAYIQHIANDVRSKRGKDTSSAIAIAIGAVKRWCRGGGNVDAETKAAACKAVAEWEKLKATHGGSPTDSAKSAGRKLLHAAERVKVSAEDIRLAEASAGPALALMNTGIEVSSEEDHAMTLLEQAVEERKAAHAARDSAAFVAALARERALREATRFRPELHPRGRGGQFRDVLSHLTSGKGSRGGGLHVSTPGGDAIASYKARAAHFPKQNTPIDYPGMPKGYKLTHTGGGKVALHRPGGGHETHTTPEQAARSAKQMAASGMAHPGSKYSRQEIEDAKKAVQRKVMIELGGHLGPALKSVTASDEDAIKYLDEKKGKAHPGSRTVTLPAPKVDTREDKNTGKWHVYVNGQRKSGAGFESKGGAEAAAGFWRGEGMEHPGSRPGDLMVSKQWDRARSPVEARKRRQLRTDTKRRASLAKEEAAQAATAASLKHPGMAHPGSATSDVETQIKDAPIHEIADIIRRDWGKVNFGAVPYLDAMHSLSSTKDSYGADSGKSVIAYFLSNAGTWKGPTAKAVKAELKRRLREAGDGRLVMKLDRLEEAQELRLAAKAANDGGAFSEADARADFLSAQIAEALPMKCPKCGAGMIPGKGKCKNGHKLSGKEGY